MSGMPNLNNIGFTDRYQDNEQMLRARIKELELNAALPHWGR